MNILNEIAEYAAYRVLLDKREYSLEELMARCRQARELYEADARNAAAAVGTAATASTESAATASTGSAAGDAYRGSAVNVAGANSADTAGADSADTVGVNSLAAAGEPSGNAQSSDKASGTQKKGLFAFLKSGLAGSKEGLSLAAHKGMSVPGAAAAGRAAGGIQRGAAKLIFAEPDEHGLYRFGQALKKPGISVISEIKKASPSKGIISEDFPYLDIAGAYERAGADCISCLTEPKWFKGSDDIFAQVRAYTSLPMIRKDFVIDEYQIYQAKLLGADAVLLICALLDTETIARYLDICRELKMDALVETHDESEIESALKAGAKIIGVNNRNLKDFSVNFDNAMRLREMIPEDRVYVAESGVKSIEDAETVKQTGADAVLIGEALMRTDDRAGFINAFK